MIELPRTTQLRIVENYSIAFGFFKPYENSVISLAKLRNEFSEADVYLCLFEAPSERYAVAKREDSDFPLDRLLRDLQLSKVSRKDFPKEFDRIERQANITLLGGLE